MDLMESLFMDSSSDSVESNGSTSEIEEAALVSPEGSQPDQPEAPTSTSKAPDKPGVLAIQVPASEESQLNQPNRPIYVQTTPVVQTTTSKPPTFTLIDKTEAKTGATTITAPKVSQTITVVSPGSTGQIRGYVPKFVATPPPLGGNQLSKNSRMVLANVKNKSTNEIRRVYVSTPGVPAPVRSQSGVVRSSIALLPRGTIISKGGVLPQNVQVRPTNVVRSKDGTLQIANGTVFRQISVMNPDLQKRLVGTGNFPQFRLVRAASSSSLGAQPPQVASVLTSSGEKKYIINSPRAVVNMGQQIEQTVQDDKQTPANQGQPMVGPFAAQPVNVGAHKDEKSVDVASLNTKVLKIPFVLQTKDDSSNNSPETRDTGKDQDETVSSRADANEPDNGNLGQNQQGIFSEEAAPRNGDSKDDDSTLNRPCDVDTEKQDEMADMEEPKVSALRKTNILSFSKPKKTLSAPVDKECKMSKEPPFIPLLEHRGSAERRKRKDCHKPKSLPTNEPRVDFLKSGHPKTALCLKSLPGFKQRIVMKTIVWDGNNVGTLPGSSLKFTATEHGTILLSESSLENKISYYVDPEDGLKKIASRDPAEIYCCVMCECYGLLSEYLSDNICSTFCYDAMSKLHETIGKEIQEELAAADLCSPEPESNKKRRLLPQDVSDDNQKPKDIEGPEKLKKRKVPGEEVDKSSDEMKCEEVDKSGRYDRELKSQTNVPKIKLKSIDILTKTTPVKEEKLTDDLSVRIPPYLYSLDLETDHLLKNDEYSVDGIPFEWADYLMVTESRPANIKLFSEPLFAPGPNPFQIGYKLEAIDPERQSKICVATIGDVSGHRLKIHFDGYPYRYDFWTYSHSPNIFPCGFCQRKGYPLEPPMGYKKKSFKWEVYHKTRKSKPAPLAWFLYCRPGNSTTNMFKVNMKLEAVDKKNTHLTCVATIRSVLFNRVLVHFDSWSDVYDYWVDVTSPYLHPVGWCKERNRILTPPSGYDEKSFSWDEYLKKTESKPAPKLAFLTRPPVDFVVGTKLEVVDKRVPHNLRVATIREVLPYQIKIAFDGYPDHFGFWCDDDSPDIHPVGYGQKSGHPVQGPPSQRELLQSKCPTAGCIGEGNYSGLTSDYHRTEQECPYSNKHLKEGPLLSDRLQSKITGMRKPVNAVDSDDECNPEKLWKFIDEAGKNAVARIRIQEDCKEQPTNFIYVPPLHQNFLPTRPDSKASTASAADKRRKRSSTQSESGESRASSPLNITVKHEPADEEANKRPKRAENEKPTCKSTDDDSRALEWPHHECLNKLKKLTPSIVEELRNLEITGGRLLMMDAASFEQLPVKHSNILLKYINDLRTRAVVGLSSWEQVKRF